MSDGGKKASSAFHLVAGLGSGALSAIILQPADLLKTRLQQQQTTSLSAALRTILHGPRPIRSLWRGATPSVLRTGFGSALYFSMLNKMRVYASTLSTPPIPSLPTSSSSSSVPLASSSSSSALPKLSNLANLTTGALARVAAGLIVNPITVLKVRYESTHFQYTSLLGAGTDIWKREGAKGFFAGFGATAVRDAPYAGLYVLIYERCKVWLAGQRGAGWSWDRGTEGHGRHGKGGRGGSWGVNFASGVVAAVSATALTNPFDAIKTRLQIAPGRYGNMVRAAGMMLREEGVGSLFRGLSMRIGRKALSSAFTWTVYEELVRRAERVVTTTTTTG